MLGLPFRIGPVLKAAIRAEPPATLSFARAAAELPGGRHWPVNRKLAATALPDRRGPTSCYVRLTTRSTRCRSQPHSPSLAPHLPD